MSVAALGYAATITLLTASLVVAVLLVVLRLHADRAERRRRRLRSRVWQSVLMLGTGESDEIDEATASLLAAGPQERRAVVADAFGLVPKLRGEARTRLRDVLRSWGSVTEAARLATSWSAVRRCRGIYRLGVLAENDLRFQVLAALDDRDFAVRRTAMLALGSFPQSLVVEQMLGRAAIEPRLRRDFLASVDRIGSAAVPVLRRELARSLAHESDDRHGELAAEALGLVGAVAAVPTLEQALETGLGAVSPALALACVAALGELGLASSVVPLAGALGTEDAEVRRTAAEALGRIGATWAVPALSVVLHDENVEVARSAAVALGRCGQAGRDVLHTSSAPVAREVVALASLRVAG
jgi:HEAT repeat protein